MLSFRHDLFRTVAYEGLLARRRREIHGRVGSMLERRAGGRRGARTLLSLHFLLAEDYERAWRYSVAVGELAKRRSANVVAAELFERALPRPTTWSCRRTRSRGSPRCSATSASSRALRGGRGAYLRARVGGRVPRRA